MTPQDQSRIEANIQNMRTKGAPEADVEAYVKSELNSTTDEEPPATNLKPNDELGFLNGGAQLFNNALHYGSNVAQAAGVPASTVHAIGGAIRDPFRAFGAAPLPNQAQIDALNARAAQQGQRPGMLGRMAGQAVSAIPLAVAAAPLTAAVGTGGGLAGLGGRVGLSMSEGGANGALNSQNPDDANQVAGNGAVGALTAGALHVGGNAIAAALAPRWSAAMQTLQNLGMRNFSLARLTGSPFLSKMEDSATGDLIAGGPIRAAQASSLNDYNTALLNQAADSSSLPRVQTANPQAYTQIQQAMRHGPDGYNATYGQINLGHDPQFATATQRAAIALRAAGRGDIADHIEQTTAPLNTPQYTPGVQNANGTVGAWGYGNLGGNDYQQFNMDLNQMQSDLAKGQATGVGGQARLGPQDRAAAQALAQYQNELQATLSRQFPDQAARLNDLDTTQAQLGTAQRAATAGQPSDVAQPSVFSPTKYRGAAMNNVGVRQRADLGSQGLIANQDVANAAMEVLGSRTGDSGTAPRNAVQNLLSGNWLTGIGSAGGVVAGAAGDHTGAIMSAALPATVAGAYGLNPMVSRALTAARPALFNQARQFSDDPAIQAILSSAAGGSSQVMQGAPQ